MAESILLNLGNVELIKSGQSKGGSDVFKTELKLPDGSRCFVSLYSSGNSVPKVVAPAEAKATSNKTQKPKGVVPSSADGGMQELREQVAAMGKMLAGLSAKLG